MMTKNSNPEPPSSQPKAGRRSAFSLIFKPDFGSSIRPIGEAGAVFVRLIAMIFLMNGLVPKNHPDLKSNAENNLSLSKILSIAWVGLSFTKEGLPKVLLFFAVIGAILLIALSAITAILLGFMGHAHADAPTQFFTVANASSDLAVNWIDFLFNPTNSATAGANIVQTTGLSMPSMSVQTALATALGMYSNAMLVIAAFILFYHLTAMVAETAHHGVTMGKRASQIWAPIRLVVAIGLLVPVSTTGLNSGQYIVIQMAKWGSALASNVWSVFVTQLTTDSYKMPPLPAPADVGPLVTDMMMMYACEYSYNYHIYDTQLALPWDLINGWSWTPDGPPVPPTSSYSVPNGTKYSFTNQTVGGYDLCGSYTIPNAPQLTVNAGGSGASPLQGLVDTISNDTKEDFLEMSRLAAQYSVKISQVMLIDPLLPNATIAVTPPPSLGDVQAVATIFQNKINNDYQSVINVNSDLKNFMDTVSSQSTQEGWIAAGAWFNKLSSVQAELNGAVTNIMPTTSPPRIGDAHKALDEASEHSHFWASNSGIKSAYEPTLVDLQKYASLLLYSDPAASGAAITDPDAAGASSCGPGDPMTCLFVLFEYVGRKNGVFQSSSTPNGSALGIQFASGNPLLEMAAFGQNCIAASMTLFKWGIYISMASGIGGMLAGAAMTIVGAVGSVVSFGTTLAIAGFGLIVSVLSAIGGVASAMIFFGAVLFLTCGMAVAFVIPFLPFMHFFFNTITWIACVAESIVGVPLVALAHLTPEGEGLPGQAAKGAYYMIFSVFLRPVMMVFGLICGLLIMIVGAYLLNALFAVAVSGTAGGSTPGNTYISHMMYTLIYVIMLYSIANHAFALIGRFPNQAMEWMGGKGLSGERMGDPGHISQGVSVAGAYFGDRLSSQMQSGLQQVNAGMKNMGEGAAKLGGGKFADNKIAAAKETGQKEAGQGLAKLDAKNSQFGHASGLQAAYESGHNEKSQEMAIQDNQDATLIGSIRERAFANGFSDVGAFLSSPDTKHQTEIASIAGKKTPAEIMAAFKRFTT